MCWTVGEYEEQQHIDYDADEWHQIVRILARYEHIDEDEYDDEQKQNSDRNPETKIYKSIQIENINMKTLLSVHWWNYMYMIRQVGNQLTTSSGRDHIS